MTPKMKICIYNKQELLREFTEFAEIATTL